MRQVIVFNNKNWPLPEPWEPPFPNCVCNYNAVNFANNEWAESHINSTEQRSIGNFSGISKLTDGSGTYLYRGTSGGSVPYLNYNSVTENPFNILKDSTTYPFTLTFICKGRINIMNRSYSSSGWDGFNSFIRTGVSSSWADSEFCVLSNKSQSARSGVYDDVVCFRLQNNTLYTWNITANTQSSVAFTNVIPTTTSRLSTTLCIFGSRPNHEPSYGWVYWWFYAKDVLSDAEVMKVVNYNNSINHA